MASDPGRATSSHPVCYQTADSEWSPSAGLAATAVGSIPSGAMVVRAETELDAPGKPQWLPTRQAQVVVLHYLEDRSVEDIAGVLDIAAGTVKAHLHRARAALAASLGLEVVDEH